MYVCDYLKLNADHMVQAYVLRNLDKLESKCVQCTNPSPQKNSLSTNKNENMNLHYVRITRPGSWKTCIAPNNEQERT